MNLREVRKKIRSFSNVKKITKAMQLISAVKMRKAQQLAVEGRPYQSALEQILSSLVRTIDTSSSPLLKTPEGAPKKELVILVSANKGMCGAFNTNLFRLLVRHENVNNMDFVSIGKKGSMFALMMRKELVADYSSNSPALETSAIFNFVLTQFLEQKYEKVSLVYNKFVSTMKWEPVHEVLFPLTVPEQTEESFSSDYLIEPSKEELFENILKDYLEEKVRSAILNSEAAEHSSRMIAMKSATDNANEVIYDLTLERNKLRQQKITYELLDMITAKESAESN